MQQIQWRVQALHRVSKYQESNHTEAAQEAISSGKIRTGARAKAFFR